jgi:hypothetical protein
MPRKAATTPKKKAASKKKGKSPLGSPAKETVQTVLVPARTPSPARSKSPKPSASSAPPPEKEEDKPSNPFDEFLKGEPAYEDNLRASLDSMGITLPVDDGGDGGDGGDFVEGPLNISREFNGDDGAGVGQFDDGEEWDEGEDFDLPDEDNLNKPLQFQLPPKSPTKKPKASKGPQLSKEDWNHLNNRAFQHMGVPIIEQPRGGKRGAAMKAATANMTEEEWKKYGEEQTKLVRQIHGYRAIFYQRNADGRQQDCYCEWDVHFELPKETLVTLRCHYEHLLGSLNIVEQLLLLVTNGIKGLEVAAFALLGVNCFGTANDLVQCKEDAERMLGMLQELQVKWDISMGLYARMLSFLYELFQRRFYINQLQRAAAPVDPKMRDKYAGL